MARLAFLGSPEPAVVCLQALHAAGHDLTIVVTGSDRRRGRGTATSPTPVKAAALRLGLRVTDVLNDVVDAGAELGVVVAFGRIIPTRVLEALPMVNVHFSLLPRWRGAAPVERAILNGDEITGISLMKVEAGLDSGPVYAAREVRIRPEDSAVSLRQRLACEGAELLVESLRDGVGSLPTPVDQVGETTYAAKITPEDLHIDWAAAADQIVRQVRVGRAWTSFRGTRVIVWEARVVTGDTGAELATRAPVLAEGAPGRIVAGPSGRPLVTTGTGFVELESLQVEGRQRQFGQDWLRGARLLPGDSFA